MNEFAAQIAEIYREKVRRARAMTPTERFLAGQELFEFAAKITLGGIRQQHPDATPARCREILRERLALRDRMDWAAAGKRRGKTPA